MEDTAYQPPFIEGRRRRSPKKRMIISSIVVVLLLILGAIGMQFLAGSTNTPSSVALTPTPTTIAFPTDTPTPSASPTAALSPTVTPKQKQSSLDAKTNLDKAKMTITVQNGSGVVGAANKAAQLLKTAGYVVTGTQNADVFTYEDITISIKPAKAAYLPLLKEDLSSEYAIAASNTTLDASSSADALVIIGK